MYAVVTELLRINYVFPNWEKKAHLSLEKVPYLNKKHHELEQTCFLPKSWLGTTIPDNMT